MVHIIPCPKVRTRSNVRIIPCQRVLAKNHVRIIPCQRVLAKNYVRIIPCQRVLAKNYARITPILTFSGSYAHIIAVASDLPSDATAIFPKTPRDKEFLAQNSLRRIKKVVARDGATTMGCVANARLI